MYSHIIRKIILTISVLGMICAVATPIYWCFLIEGVPANRPGILGFVGLSAVGAAIFAPHLQYLNGNMQMQSNIAARIFGLLVCIVLSGISVWFLVYTIVDPYVLSVEFGIFYFLSLVLMGFLSILQYGFLCGFKKHNA